MIALPIGIRVLLTIVFIAWLLITRHRQRAAVRTLEKMVGVKQRQLDEAYAEISRVERNFRDLNESARARLAAAARALDIERKKRKVR